MGFEEEEIQEYQRKRDEEGTSDESSSNSEGEGDNDEEAKLLDIEALRQRDDLTDKQLQMLNKIEGIRRQLKKIIDKKAKYN